MTTTEQLLKQVKKELEPLIDQNLDGTHWEFHDDVWRIKRVTAYVKDDKLRVCFNFEMRLEDETTFLD